jgi:hypothetical protein
MELTRYFFIPYYNHFLLEKARKKSLCCINSTIKRQSILSVLNIVISSHTTNYMKESSYAQKQQVYRLSAITDSSDYIVLLKR